MVMGIWTRLNYQFGLPVIKHPAELVPIEVINGHKNHLEPSETVKEIGLSGMLRFPCVHLRFRHFRGNGIMHETQFPIEHR